MASPFPGMDPYIEACGLWEDFHPNLISEIQRALEPSLPDHYVIRAGERSYVVLAAEGENAFQFLPDVTVASRGIRGKQKTASPLKTVAAVGTLEPQQTPVKMHTVLEEEQREPFLEILQLRPERKLVTCIEVLSPSNKRFGTAGWDEYYRKRQACLHGPVNFVEIDLLRGGRRMPMREKWPDSPYYLLVSRRTQATRCTVWPAHALVPLPKIPIPLAHPDPDLTLDLQPLIEAIHARSRYHLDIDYHQPLRLPLSALETAWLEKHLAGRGPSEKKEKRKNTRKRQ